MKTTARSGSSVILPLGFLLAACFLLGGCSKAFSSVTSVTGAQPNATPAASLPVLLNGMPRQQPAPPNIKPGKITVEHATINVPD